MTSSKAELKFIKYGMLCLSKKAVILLYINFSINLSNTNNLQRIVVNMQFSGLNKIHSQLTAYIQAKLSVRLRFRVRVRLGLGLELGLVLGLTDRMHALACIGSKLTVYFV